MLRDRLCDFHSNASHKRSSNNNNIPCNLSHLITNMVHTCMHITRWNNCKGLQGAYGNYPLSTKGTWVHIARTFQHDAAASQRASYCLCNLTKHFMICKAVSSFAIYHCRNANGTHEYICTTEDKNVFIDKTCNSLYLYFWVSVSIWKNSSYENITIAIWRKPSSQVLPSAFYSDRAGGLPAGIFIK